MGGFDLHVPTGSIDARMADGSRKSTDTKSSLWATPHAYVTHQLDDRFWVGLGMFSRFGADNEFSDSWFGRYNMTSAQARTISFVPSLAMKVNDAWSVSAGVEVMYADFTMTRQIPSLQYMGPFPQKGPDSKERRTSTGWGMGLHLGSHWRMTDALSLGVAYKSPVTLRLNGRAEYSLHQPNFLAEKGEVPHTVDTDTDTKIHLPGSLALGLAYKPMDNLSVEVGTVRTGHGSIMTRRIIPTLTKTARVAGATAGMSMPVWNTSRASGSRSGRGSGMIRRRSGIMRRGSCLRVTGVPVSGWASG